jgi:hypothetical protein
MSNNSQSTSTTHAHSESIGHAETTTDTFKLPNDYRTLGVMKDAITKKMEEMRTTGAETLRSMLLQESEALGLSPEEILGIAAKKPRGRRRTTKRDE